MGNQATLPELRSAYGTGASAQIRSDTASLNTRNSSADELRTDSHARMPRVTVLMYFGNSHCEYAIYGDSISERYGEKYPTLFLIDSNNGLIDFGKSAESKFSQLCRESKRSECYFLSGLTSEDKLCTSHFYKSKSEIPLPKLFEMIIIFFKRTIESKILEYYPLFNCNTLDWAMVLSGGATEQAAIKEAASRSIKDPEKLVFYMEDAVLARFCQSETLHTSSMSSHVNALPHGHLYLLAKIGGSTTTIYVNEVLSNSQYKQHYKKTVAIGGDSVTLEFALFMTSLVKYYTWKSFMINYPDCFVRKMKDFEQIKRRYKGHTECLHVEHALKELFASTQGIPLEERVSALNRKYVKYNEIEETITLSGDKIATFFKPVIDGVTKQLRDAIKECKAVKTLIFLGGFAQSPHFQRVMQERFEDLKCVYPLDAKLAIVKGGQTIGCDESQFPQGVSHQSVKETERK